VGVDQEADPLEAAKAFVIELDGGTPGRAAGQGSAITTANTTLKLVPPYAIVGAEPLDEQLAGIRSSDYSGPAVIDLRLPRKIGAETPPESLRRGKNTIGAIRAQCAARYGSSGCLGTGTATSEGPFLPDETGSQAEEMTGGITLNWSA
jgi:hypothetical protein